jgi:hypothetical protein
VETGLLHGWMDLDDAAAILDASDAKESEC